VNLQVVSNGTLEKEKGMNRTLALSIFVLVFITGCASYKPSSAPVPEIGTMPACRTEGTITVGADPYVQPDRLKAVFDADLNKVGVLPIQVLVRNTGDRSVLVQKAFMLLVLPDGRQLCSAGATAVVAKLEKPSSHFWPTFFLGIPGAVGAQAADDKARANRMADYRSKEFQDVTLGKDQFMHGFVYFIPPVGAEPFTEATLTVPVVDAAEATRFIVRLPLSGLRVKGVPAKAD
jgi:hypothetical protein